jgi:BetI-type transcriptional repressor, C-terminal
MRASIRLVLGPRRGRRVLAAPACGAGLTVVGPVVAAGAGTAAVVSRGLTAMIDEHRRLVLLMNEFWALAVRDERLRDRWVQRQRRLRDSLARTLEARHKTTGVPLTVPAERLATAVIAMADGLAMDRVAEPDAVPPDLRRDALAALRRTRPTRIAGQVPPGLTAPPQPHRPRVSCRPSGPAGARGGSLRALHLLADLKRKIQLKSRPGLAHTSHSQGTQHPAGLGWSTECTACHKGRLLGAERVDEAHGVDRVRDT